MGIFEALASEDFESKQARSRAITATTVRAREMFDPFLKQASSAADKSDRILLIENDLQKIAGAVAIEYGFDNPTLLYAEARAKLACTCDDDDCKGCDCKECHGSKKDDADDADGKKSWDKPWEKDAAENNDGDSYQKERSDLPKADETGLGGPEPKIDKGSAGDEVSNSQSPIDIGSKKHPLTHQKPTDRADYDKKDFDPSSPTRERVDISKPMQPEYTKGDATETWHGTSGQADAVTSGNPITAAKYSLISVE